MVLIGFGYRFSLVDGAESNRLCSKPSIGALRSCTYAVLIAPSLRWRNRVEMLMQPPLCVTLLTDSRPPPWRCPSHIPSVIGLWFTAHRGSPTRFGRHHVRYTHTNSTSDRICRLRNLSYRRCIRNPTAHLLSCSNAPRGIVCKVLLTLRGDGGELLGIRYSCGEGEG
jgi:hypothetical protein